MQLPGGKILQPFFENFGGLNLTDSTFTIKPNQATGGYNFEYVKTGGIQKSLCPARLNSSADAQLRTLGLFLRNTKAGTKSIIRAAGLKLQLTDLGGTFTNLTEDTAAAASDFLEASTEQPVVGSMTTSTNADVLWLAGGGMSSIYGVASETKVTANGVAAPTGAISALEGAGGGDWDTTGTYYYAVAYRKRSTQALSNADLDIAHTLTSTANSVVISLSGLTNLDSTKYDKVYLYRSAVGGVTDFTTGSLVAQADSTATSITDTGSAVTTADNVPRSGNTVLDNSVLPSGDYKVLTTWKRRLVTAKESTLYISDLNKFESFPATNTIDVPSGGEIFAVAVISFTTPSATTTDEFLAVFKESELWILTGNSSADWSLKFVDSTGCLAQPLVVSANGYLYFIDHRGVYLWDGAGKPVYISRPIEELFGSTGRIERAKLRMGFGAFVRRQNQVVWCLSNSDVGEQRYLLKLDLRLTLPQVSNTLGQRIIDGTFLPGKIANAAYAGASFIFPTSSSQEDLFITGDGAGYIYRQMYTSTGVGSDDYDFTYKTKFLDMGKPRVAKRFEKVVVWVESLGDWDLTLDYWTDFRSGTQNKHTIPVSINPTIDGTAGLWDVGRWDEAEWDGYQAAPKAITFNLQAAPYNNSEGEVLMLQFRNQGSDEPVTIYGFSVLYSDIAVRS